VTTDHVTTDHVGTAPHSAAAAAAEEPTSFGTRQVQAIAGCYFVASFAALGLPPYLTLILPELGDPEARWAGLLYVVPTVFAALGGPFWGQLADRFGHKPLLLRAQLGLTASFLLAGAADSLTLFAAALALQGLLGGTYAATNGYLGAALGDGPAMSKALTLMQAAARAALVMAPITVGLLSPWISPHRQYLLLAILPLTAALMLTAMPAPPRSGSTAPVKDTGQAQTTAATSRLRPPYGLYLLEFAFVFCTVVSFPYLVALLEERAAGSPSELSGFLFALPHLCFLAAAVPLHGILTRRPHATIATGFALVALGLAGHTGADSLAGFLAVRVLFGAGLTCGLVGLAALAAQAARGRRPGHMFGWLELASKGGAVGSGLVATAANAAWGPVGPMLAGTAAATIAALLLAFTSPCTVHPTRRHRWSIR